jgi:hypothetical protein
MMIGNCSTEEIESLIRARVELIRAFDADPGATFLAISAES